MSVGIRPFAEKVFNISTINGSGTAFTYKSKDTEYLITAKHVVESMGNSGVISINRMNDSIQKNVSIYYPRNKDIDIAVLKYDGCLVDSPMDLKYYVDGLETAQDAYFLGYPFSYCSFTNNELKENAFRFPIIKKGIISGAQALKESVVIFIDAHNNQGFSGGPVVVFDYERVPRVCGVVSGYIPYEGSLYERGTDIVIDKMTYRENSGIMLAYGIDHAIDIINEINWNLLIQIY